MKKAPIDHGFSKRNQRRLGSGELPDPSRIQSVSTTPAEATAEFRSVTTGFSAMGVRNYSSSSSFSSSGSSSFGFLAKRSVESKYVESTIDAVMGEPKTSFAVQKQLFSKSPSMLSSSLHNQRLRPPPGKVIVPATWSAPELMPVPSLYPMERSNRVLSVHEGHTLSLIASRISSALRMMSIQAKYINKPASAALLTPEHVEIWLALWKTQNGGIQIEVQRRRGDSVTFHRYGRYILEAAGGDFCPDDFRIQSASLAYLKNAETMLTAGLGSVADRQREAEVALELVHDLLTNDRLDARLLGLESLSLLTDPRRTRVDACKLAARAVLFGSGGLGETSSIMEKVHEIVLNIAQKRCMGDEDKLLEGMAVDYDSDDDDDDFFVDDEQQKEFPPEYNGTITVLVHHALNVLANAWEVMATFDEEPEMTVSKTNLKVETFLYKATEQTENDMLFSLLCHIRRADTKPHNATSACKTLRLLCQESPVVVGRTQKLGGLSVVENAQLIGKGTNARLEDEARRLIDMLR